MVIFIVMLMKAESDRVGETGPILFASVRAKRMGPVSDVQEVHFLNINFSVP